MKMKKISKSRWGILALVVVGLIVLFNVAGCAMLEAQMTKAKDLVGMAPDKDIILCEGTECEIETPVVTEDIRG
jgi:hypothetical protein